MSRIQISDKELLELIEQGKTSLEIVRIKGIRYETLIRRTHKIDKTLLDEAMQKGQTKREETIQKEQEAILELIRQGKNQFIIAEAMNVQQIDISMRIREIDKGLVDEAIKEGIRQGFVRVSRGRIEIKQEDILEPIRQGKKQSEIATILGVSVSTISKRIMKIDKALEDEAINEAVQHGLRRAREEVKQEEILELMKEGKMQHEIAEKLEVSVNTINKKTKEIGKTLVDAARQEAVQHGLRKRKGREKIQIKKEDILELMKEGKTQQEMAEELEVSVSTINKRIKEINVDFEIFRIKMNEGQLTRSDVQEYRSIIDEKYNRVTREEIILLVNAYIKTKQTTEAIRFLNTIISDEGLKGFDKEKIKNLKIQVEQIQKRQMVRRMLRDGKKINYIMTQTGLKETEIVAIKEEMEQKLGREI